MIDKIKKATKNPANTYYISWRTKIPENEVEVIVEDLLNQGKLKESHYAEGYYQWVESEEK